MDISMDMSMDIYGKSVDIDMDMDGKFYTHSKPAFFTAVHCGSRQRNRCGYLFPARK